MKYKLHVNEAGLPKSSPLVLPYKTGLQGLFINYLTVAVVGGPSGA